MKLNYISPKTCKKFIKEKISIFMPVWKHIYQLSKLGLGMLVTFQFLPK